MSQQTAHYDTYDYPSYWKGRDYEHECEVFALQSLLKKKSTIKKLLDVGGGYGRLIPHYLHYAEEVVLAEPSGHLLDIAKNNYKSNSHISYVHSPIEDLLKNIKPNSMDAVVMIRVMHHLSNPLQAIEILSKLLRKNGVLVLEFANKIHGKATFANLCRGDFSFTNDVTPSDRRCVENKSSDTISFYNYHPRTIQEALEKSKLKILAKRSVSNVRSPLVKKYISLSGLIGLEKLLQEPLAPLYFGPSIFILAQK